MRDFFNNPRRYPVLHLPADTYQPTPTTKPTPAPGPSYAPGNPAYHALATLAANAMREALSPPPFGSEQIAADRLAHAHYMRGLALAAYTS